MIITYILLTFVILICLYFGFIFLCSGDSQYPSCCFPIITFFKNLFKKKK